MEEISRVYSRTTNFKLVHVVVFRRFFVLQGAILYIPIKVKIGVLEHAIG